MNWESIKLSIVNDLELRKLKQSSRRINELNRIEKNLKNHFKEIYENPSILRDIDREEFKSKYAKVNSKLKLNGAEDSLINEVYYRI